MNLAGIFINLIILTIFGGATAYEIKRLRKYLHLSDWQEIQKIIRFLNQVKNKEEVNQSIDNVWLRERFGTDDVNTLENQYQHKQKFILRKYPTVLARPIARSHLRFVTALCTSIGVLGTFYGIQQGLQNLNLGDISNSQQLMTSSIELLKNMKTAFSTSLMGLGCGSLFTLVLFVTDSLRRKRRNGLRDKLDNLATFETAENDTRILARQIQQLRQSLTNQQSPSAEAIGEAVGKSIANKFTQLNQLTSEAIGKAVARRMRSPLGHIYQEQQRMRELQENQGQQVFEQLIQELRIQIIEPVADRLNESAELTRQASQAVTNLHNELGGISQSLASSIETIQNFQQETLVELQNFANNLGQTLNQFINQSQIVFEQQNSTLETVGNQASELMNSAKDNLLATLGDINQTLTETRQTVQDDLTKFRDEYKNNLQAFFKEQNNLLEKTLGQQRDGLSEVVRNLNTIFNDEYNRRSELAQQVNQSMNQVSTAATEVNKLVCAVGLNSSTSLVQQENIARELNQISRNLNQQVEGVQREYRQLSDTFSNSLTDWKNHFGESRQTFFNEADSAMANVCSSLLHTAEALVAANDNRNNGNGRNHHA
ncbi:MAG: hypothetical protein WBA39_25705 [Rivularia sp. (in: cyanobacteria)]